MESESGGSTAVPDPSSSSKKKDRIQWFNFVNCVTGSQNGSYIQQIAFLQRANELRRGSGDRLDQELELPFDRGRRGDGHVSGFGIGPVNPQLDVLARNGVGGGERRGGGEVGDDVEDRGVGRGGRDEGERRGGPGGGGGGGRDAEAAGAQGNGGGRALGEMEGREEGFRGETGYGCH